MEPRTDDTAKPDQITAFLDTNSLLHYRPIAEVDWRSVLCAPRVKLIVCLQVITELDEKKNHPDLHVRARRTLKEISTLAKQSAVRPGVTLEVFNHVLRHADFPNSMSPDNSDDKIVFHVKAYEERNPAESICVVTEDLGMELRCSANAVRVAKPSEGDRLESPRSQQQKKLTEALREIERLKNVRPDVRVCVPNPDGSAGPLKVKLEQGASSIDIEEYLERKKQANIGLSHSRLCVYLGACRVWANQENALRERRSREFSFDIVIYNQGSAPAEGIDIQIDFPKVLTSLSFHDEFVGRRPPEFVPEPSVPLELSGAPPTVLPERDFVDLPATRVGFGDGGVILRSYGQQFQIRVGIERLLHGKQHALRGFRAEFGSSELVVPFHADLSLIIGNVADRDRRELHFLVEPGSG